MNSSFATEPNFYMVEKVSIKRESGVCLKWKPHTTNNSSIRSNEGLTLETSAFESLYGGQFTSII